MSLGAQATVARGHEQILVRLGDTAMRTAAEQRGFEQRDTFTKVGK